MELGLNLRLGGFAKSAVGAPDPSAGYALYLDFKNSLYRSGATKTADVTTLPGYTYTRSGAKSELLSTGVPTAFAANVPGIVPTIGYWSRAALTNLLLNAGTATTLGTQTTAALTAVPYTIYFEGTGSVALSGSFTGSLAGTGANNMVALVFTPTAAALTVTVTGSVTYAGLVLGNYPSGAAVIPTAGATASIGADAMATTANPISVDQDYIVWVVGNWRNTSETSASYLADFGLDRLFMGRDSANGARIGINGTLVTPVGGVLKNRVALLYRRKAGKDSIAVKDDTSTVTVGAETLRTWVAQENNLFVGAINGGGAQPGANVEGVFVQLGTFSDAQLTTILTAA